MLSLMRSAASFFWREADAGSHQRKPYKDYETVMDVEGVITRFCNDYGMINDQIYFTPDVVIGREPLSVEDKVYVSYQEDKTSGGWRAIKVQRISGKWEINNHENQNALDLDIKVLIGTVTFCNKDGGEINQTTYFSMCDVCEGYVPYKGDWVRAEYFINSSTWNSEAISIKPLRCKRVDEVKVTAFYGMTGVIDDSIYFTVDAIQLPEGMSSDNEDSNSPHSAVLMMNKGGLEVSRMTHFGVIKQGQSKSLNISIENKGNDVHSLVSCKVAGLEKENKFKFEMSAPESDLSSVSSPTLQSPSSSMCDAATCNLNETVRSNVLPLVMTANWVNTGLCHTPYKTSGYHLKYMTGFAPPFEASTLNSSNDALMSPVHTLPMVDSHVTAFNGQLRPGNFPTVHGLGDLDVSKMEACESSKADIHEALLIHPGEKIFITVTCEARNPGRCKELALFCFQDFVIGRYIEATVQSEEEFLLLPPKEFSSRDKKKLHELERSNNLPISVSVPYKRPSRRQLPSFLPMYPIPERLRKCVEQNMDVLAIEPCLGELLTLSNYRNKMSTLLWLDDIHNEIEMKEFTLSGVSLQKRGGFLILEVPGIIEGRPSLNHGDRVLLKNQTYSSPVVEFVGLIAEIHDEEVSLRVNANLEQSYNYEPMEVEFNVNRTSSRRCQFAVEQAKHLGQAVLFPETVVLQSPQIITTGINMLDYVAKKEQTGTQQENQRKPCIREKNAICMSDMVTVATQTNSQGEKTPVKKMCKFFNPMLNDRQKLAVTRILSGDCRPTPYILFGPPGTGKTVTVIEAILQIHYALPDSRILVCAPSNSAADLVCLRLHESGQLERGSMVRVNASRRQEETINDIVKPYCGPGEDIQKASRFRIIISTCSSAGMFYQIGLRVGHFTHVMVDEAGQATEPECLIPLGLVSEVTGQIILAGDPMQLGPVIKSKIALAHGLSISLLERLMSLPVYLRDEETYGACGNYNPLLVTKLMKNYRSHSSLLHLPSKLFYHKELEVCADPAVVNRLLRWDKLPKRGFPLIFHGVRGTEMREGSNPSWFNPSEAVQVMRYCCILAKHVTTSVSARDIGVITPYRKQVEKIRTLLRTVDLMDIKVGSVEEFQGQEFLIIIISMVRSCEDSLYNDSRTLLGFLCNPKRFNVATTRPKALLIVLGNPHILMKDPCACALLEYSIINGAYTGCNLPLALESLQQCD
ncbi:RNA helicase Mov10l1 isoform 3-T3 [Anomaloglossus baeobatrachus]